MKSPALKILVIGGNRFVGLRLTHMLEKLPGCEIHVLNRTGQVAHSRSAIVHKGDRSSLALTHLDHDWDLIYDFACFNRREAESALNYFKKVGSYILISTAAVYEEAADLHESAFAPAKWNLNTPLNPGAEGRESYQHGKRQAETVFTASAPFPVLSVRFPVILGPDDYTHRLDFHIRQAASGEPIYAVNPDARFSMVHAQDAADFLMWAREKKLRGPMNVASPEPTSLKGLCAQIELVAGDRAIIEPPPKLEREEQPSNISPYSPTKDWYLNVEHMQATGFKTRPISAWLPELIGVPDISGRKGFVH